MSGSTSRLRDVKLLTILLALSLISGAVVFLSLSYMGKLSVLVALLISVLIFAVSASLLLEEARFT